MIPASSLLFLSLATGCFTQVHAVTPMGPNEFLMTVRPVSIIGIPGQVYVVRCKDIVDPVGEQVACQRILTGPEVLSISPGQPNDGHATFTIREKQ